VGARAEEVIEHDSELVEAVAATAYAHSFSARMSHEDWARVKERAWAGGAYANVIVDRCYQQAFDMINTAWRVIQWPNQS
jgi:hypothetical protein